MKKEKSKDLYIDPQLHQRPTKPNELLAEAWDSVLRSVNFLPGMAHRPALGRKKVRITVSVEVLP